MSSPAHLLFKMPHLNQVVYGPHTMHVRYDAEQQPVRTSRIFIQNEELFWHSPCFTVRKFYPAHIGVDKQWHAATLRRIAGYVLHDGYHISTLSTTNTVSDPILCSLLAPTDEDYFRIQTVSERDGNKNDERHVIVPFTPHLPKSLYDMSNLGRYHKYDVDLDWPEWMIVRQDVLANLSWRFGFTFPWHGGISKERTSFLAPNNEMVVKKRPKVTPDYGKWASWVCTECWMRHRSPAPVDMDETCPVGPGPHNLSLRFDTRVATEAEIDTLTENSLSNWEFR